MAEMIPIRFSRPSMPYMKGEVAWFNELQAAAYIKQGFADRAKEVGHYVPTPARAALVDQAAIPGTPALR